MPINSNAYQRAHQYFALSSDVLPRYYQGACRPVPPNRQGTPKPKGPGGHKLILPPIGGWVGGHPDNNGRSKTETYGNKGIMRRSDCMNKGKPN